MTSDRDRWGYKYTEEIFEYLKQVAARAETVSYEKVTDDVGGNPRTVGGRELTAIQLECDKRGWPHLNALVVAMKTGLPGNAYQPNHHPVAPDEFKRISDSVCAEDWTDKHL